MVRLLIRRASHVCHLWMCLAELCWISPGNHHHFIQPCQKKKANHLITDGLSCLLSKPVIESPHHPDNLQTGFCLAIFNRSIVWLSSPGRMLLSLFTDFEASFHYHLDFLLQKKWENVTLLQLYICFKKKMNSYTGITPDFILLFFVNIFICRYYSFLVIKL